MQAFVAEPVSRRPHLQHRGPPRAGRRPATAGGPGRRLAAQPDPRSGRRGPVRLLARQGPGHHPDAAGRFDQTSSLFGISTGPNTWPISLFLDQVREMRQSSRAGCCGHPALLLGHHRPGHDARASSPPPRSSWASASSWTWPTIRPSSASSVAWIVDAYVKLIHLFADAAGMNVTGLHTGECSGCMMGPDQFAEFALPYLNDLARPRRAAAAALLRQLQPSARRLSRDRTTSPSSTSAATPAWRPFASGSARSGSTSCPKPTC